VHSCQWGWPWVETYKRYQCGCYPQALLGVTPGTCKTTYNKQGAIFNLLRPHLHDIIFTSSSSTSFIMLLQTSSFLFLQITQITHINLFNNLHILTYFFSLHIYIYYYKIQLKYDTKKSMILLYEVEFVGNLGLNKTDFTIHVQQLWINSGSKQNIEHDYDRIYDMLNLSRILRIMVIRNTWIKFSWQPSHQQR